MQKVKFKRFKKAALVLLSAAYSACVFAQTPDSLGIVYVKPTATGTGMGTSWGDATDDLQGAINAAGATKVFVAVGTYPRTTASLIMKNNVAIYGGFDPENGVNDLSDNRILPNLGMGSGSVLDGLNARPLIWNDNNGLDNSAVLDGFTLTNGYSNNHGGAIYTRSSAPYYNNLVISNCKAANGGGGIHNNNSPIYLGNAVIESDSAKYGAAIFNQGSNSTFENLRIFDNVATQTTAGAGGGAIFNDNSDFLATNVLIYNNTTGFQGGAFVNLSGNPTLTNVTIANNTADVDFSGLDIRGGNPTINNSIILDTNSGVYVAKHSLIEGNADLINGNLDATGITATDIFADAANGDYSILLGSVVFNAGSDALYPGLNSTTKDLAGNSRKAGISIDLGAYEYQAILSPDGITYVKPVATGTGFGNDWANAMGNLQEAINSPGTKVLVAVGNYIVPPSSFSMKSGVEIYGGFEPDSSGITDLSHSRILPNLGMGDGSVLDGQNTRRVIFNAAGADHTALLDGFTLTNGYGSNGGGAIYNVNNVSPTFNNLVIKNNETAEAGGGVFNNTTGQVNVSNTVIKDNTAAYGGGVYNNSAPARFTNVSITGNTATMATVGAGAGGFFNTSANPSLTNVLIADNATNFRGGGFVNLHGTPVLTNVTLAGNTADSSYAGMDIRFGTPQFRNTIVLGDVFGSYTAQYSLVEGDTSVSDGNLDATGITAADIFADTANGDYSILLGSVVFNAGSDALYPGLNSTTKDLAANSRKAGISIDLGAYEYQALLSPDGIVYVKPVATGTGFGNDWANATGNLQEAINSAGTKVFVSVGNYIVPPSSFSMKSGVEIYGGFDPDNGVTDLSHNRILPNLGMGDGSVLDGQNTRRVIFNAAGVDSTALLDGFTLTNGKSTGNGGAIYNVGGVSPTFNNLVIKNNEASEAGAGLYNNTTGRTRVSNTIIKDNTAAYGGGVYNNASNAVFTDVSITRNTATMATVGAGGGGFFNTNANPSLTNVLIADNATNFRGGGFVNLYGTPVFTNVTLADNVANVEFDAMDVRFGNPQIHNTIVWGDIFGTYTAQYSLVEGDTSVSDGNLDATGITAADIFTDAANADYSLTASSPAVNAGNNVLFAGLSSSTVDLARNPRLFGATIDLGAYEKQCANSLWTDTRSECFPYTWIDGNTYNAATNTVVYRIPNASGCDSVITLNLTETVIDTVVTQNQQTLTAAESNADSYQWIDCANNMPVSGATSQTYTPTANGIYAVEITVGDCEITSECVVVSSIGIGEAETGNWSVYPNPAHSQLNIAVQDEMDVHVLNMLGQVVWSINLKPGNNLVDVSGLTPGVYAIQATTGAGFKFIKE